MYTPATSSASPEHPGSATPTLPTGSPAYAVCAHPVSPSRVSLASLSPSAAPDDFLGPPLHCLPPGTFATGAARESAPVSPSPACCSASFSSRAALLELLPSSSWPAAGPLLAARRAIPLSIPRAGSEDSAGTSKNESRYVCVAMRQDRKCCLRPDPENCCRASP